MKHIFPTTALIFAGFLMGCSSAEGVREDAEKTPIGSVLSGETKDADAYLKRVSDQNRATDADTWRPMSNERF